MISIEITEPNTFDLVELKEQGLEKLLASQEIATGKYTQIRMTIKRVEVGLERGELREAKLPGGELKFVRPFNVVEGQAAVLLLDFDVEESVIITGNGEISFKPVVRLAITSPVISVEITPPEDGAALTESPVTVEGAVSDPAATVTANGVAVEVATDGTFSTQVELTEGENTITTVASFGEQQTTDSIMIAYHSPPEP